MYGCSASSDGSALWTSQSISGSWRRRGSPAIVTPQTVQPPGVAGQDRAQRRPVGEGRHGVGRRVPLPVRVVGGEAEHVVRADLVEDAAEALGVARGVEWLRR